MKSEEAIKNRIWGLERAKAAFLSPPFLIYSSDSPDPPPPLTDSDWIAIQEALGNPGSIVELPRGYQIKEQRPPDSLESINTELAALRWVLEEEKRA